MPQRLYDHNSNSENLKKYLLFCNKTGFNKKTNFLKTNILPIRQLKIDFYTSLRNIEAFV